MQTEKEIIYIAIPYSHWNPWVRGWRFRQANKIAAKFMELGHIVFSPISHSHPIGAWITTHQRNSLEFWMQQDQYFLSKCTVILVVKIPGWDHSSGIISELKLARLHRLRIWFYDPRENTVSMHPYGECGNRVKVEIHKIKLNN